MLKIGSPRNKGSVALRHFLTVYGQKTMYVHLVRQGKSCRFQHAWPKQRMEIGDVLANEMVNLAIG